MSQWRLDFVHQTVVSGLVQTLGADWLLAEERKAGHKQHILLPGLKQLLSPPEPADQTLDEVSGPVTGLAREVIALATDICCLRAVGALPDSHVARLRDRLQYQGVRYEIGVASCFVRSGLSVEWIEGGGVEFMSRVPGTDCTLAVEAKSRHRAGAVHHPGSIAHAATAADVGKLLKKARQKKVGDHPLIVFIDLNLPDRPERDGVPFWLPEIRQIVRRFESGGEAARFALAFFTNFSWHYAGSRPVAERPAASSFVPRNPIRPLRYPLIRELLMRALEQWGSPVPSPPRALPG